MNLLRLAVPLLALSLAATAAPLPPGDTQGLVSAVRLLPLASGVSSFQIWFSSVSNDRFSCVSSNGYIVVAENGYGMNAASYSKLFSLALAAQASGKVLAIDSYGVNPCTNANTGWMFD